MKYLQTSIKYGVFFFLIVIGLSSCSSGYVQLVPSDTKTEFGITLTAPSQGIFFVQNEKISAPEKSNTKHIQVSNFIYNVYGPATDKMFVGRTNARQLKFSLNDKTYLVDVTKLKKRNAMVLFDAKSKPIIIYNTKRYLNVVQKYFGRY